MSRHGILGVFALFACLLLAWPSLAQQTQELWVARQDGWAPAGIAVDSTGNAYVTGFICAATDPYWGCTEIDWETVNYDTNGNALWTARFAGDGNSYNYPSAIAVDASSNVYVSGDICTELDTDGVVVWCGSSDYSTIKYDPNGAM